ncbi:MAG: c-type cytochrome, partial [Saprospiraceae bacterium]
YLVKISGCRSCHGPQLNGGKDPNPEAPMGPNLTPGGNLSSWGAEGFMKSMRTGITPLGKELNGKFMPWKEIGHYDDDQLQAIYAYLTAQPSLATAEIKN